MNPAFENCIGIDYSGAQMPKSSLSGLRVYAADCTASPQEVHPPPSTLQHLYEFAGTFFL
jgi:hypothetical protein